MRRPNSKLAIGTALLGLSLIASAPAWADATILNVSYDPTRELYARVQQGVRRALEGSRPARRSRSSSRMAARASRRAR